MTKRPFVGNLSYRTTEGSLAGLFEQAGDEEWATIIAVRDASRWKSFGLVEMESQNADKSIAWFDGVELKGRSLVVNERTGEKSVRTIAFTATGTATTGGVAETTATKLA